MKINVKPSDQKLIYYLFTIFYFITKQFNFVVLRTTAEADSNILKHDNML